MIPILNPKRFYRSTIKIMSLMLLASCAIHAADNDSNNVVPSTTSTQTTATTSVQCNPEVSDLEALSPELLREVGKYLDLRSILALTQTSRDLERKVAQWPALSNEEKSQADAHIDKMFGDYHDSENKKSIAQLIKDSFDSKDLTCRELYRSCAHMTEFPSNNFIKLLINSFSNNPLNILNVIIHHKAFLRRNMYIHEITGIIKALARHSAEQIAAIAVHASQFFTEGMNGNNRVSIISALAPLSAEQIAAIAAHTSQLSTEGMIEQHRAELIEALVLLSADKIQAICTHASQLLGDVDGDHRVSIIHLFYHLSAEQLQAICAHASQLLGDVDGYYRFKIIEALFHLSAEQLQAICAHASQLFTEGMNGNSRVSIISALAPLSAEQIAGIAGKFTPKMDGYERIKLIKSAY